MKYRSWIKLLGLLLAINVLTLVAAIYGKSRFDSAWDEYKEQRSMFMANCQSEGADWGACWDSFNNDHDFSLKAAALEKAHPFNSRNSNQFFGYAITSFGVTAAIIFLSIFLRAARRFFGR